jgi:phenylalanyl-tRNA synthetase beta chain
MRVPLSWLREVVDLPTGAGAVRDVARRLTRAGFVVEGIETAGGAVIGPVVTGRVLEYADEPQKNGKTVRWCQVQVGEGDPRGIVCGAHNFAVGDVVVVALPGSVLPGDFAISARKAYGHVSDGMICSSRELGVGDDHEGILVLPEGTPVGRPAVDLLGLADEVLDVAVTPDRGYALSLRGLGRELATSYGVPFRDPAALDMTAASAEGWPVRVDDRSGCTRFVARTVTGLDPAAASPLWLSSRVRAAGMRPISLAVDVTNYVMLELGQPIHGYDGDRLAGEIVVRRARAGERLRTLDGAERALDPEDLLITDGSGPIGIAGVMGGGSTELSASTTSVVVEAAHFDAVSIARSARRHKLPSEASRRFERGVDPELAPAAAQRVVDLLVALGGATAEPGVTEIVAPRTPRTIALPAGRVSRTAGREVAVEVVRLRLEQVGCAVEGDDPLTVTPPSWRPDLRDPADLDEEVLRLEGYESIPSRVPQAPAGRGLTWPQRARREVTRALADAGLVETPTYPFVGPAAVSALGLPEGDPRRAAVRLANPLSEEEPLLRTTLLPGLLAALGRNTGRGNGDVGLFETGLVFLPRPGAPDTAPRLAVDRRPTPEELDRVEAALPAQPTHLAVVLTGDAELPGWWGRGRPATWADAVEAVRTAARAAGAAVTVRRGERAPWHPGRCAELVVSGPGRDGSPGERVVGEQVVGWAGELHPRVLEALGLPPRTCAAEVDLDLVVAAGGGLPSAPHLSTYPVAKEDVALVVDADVPAAEVEAALRAGAGPLLESLRLFDVYTGPQVGEGRRSLAYALRLRAPDRTLTVEEATAARDGAVAEAARRTGAQLRS